MDTNGRFSVVIWPNQDAQDALNELRARYDAHYHLIGPHITVAFPDTVALPLGDIRAGIREAARVIPPFTAVFDRWVSYSDLMQTHAESTRFLIDRYPNAVNLIVALAGQGAQQMLAMRRIFAKTIPQPDLLVDYPIYTTIGQSLSDEALIRAKSEMATVKLNLAVPVTSYELLAEQPDGTWPLVERYVLEGSEG
jgi:2'-5' RNA ligase